MVHTFISSKPLNSKPTLIKKTIFLILKFENSGKNLIIVIF